MKYSFQIGCLPSMCPHLTFIVGRKTRVLYSQLLANFYFLLLPLFLVLRNWIYNEHVKRCFFAWQKQIVILFEINSVDVDSIWLFLKRKIFASRVDVNTEFVYTTIPRELQFRIRSKQNRSQKQTRHILGSISIEIETFGACNFVQWEICLESPLN